MSVGDDLSVLAIDDDEEICQEIRLLLELRKVDCKTATDMEAARAVLATDRDRRIIIVDYHLPGISGPEIMELLRREFPVDFAFILLTGEDSQQAAVDAVRAGAIDFLRKPPDGRALLRSIDHARTRLAAATAVTKAPAQLAPAPAPVVAANFDLREPLMDLASQIRERERYLERFCHDMAMPHAEEGSGWRRALSILLKKLNRVRDEIERGAGHCDAAGAEQLSQEAELLIDILAAFVVTDLPLATERSAAPLFDLRMVMERARRSTEQIVRRRKLMLEFTIPSTPIMISGDSERLIRSFDEILRSLCGHLQADDRGRLTLTATRRETEFRLEIYSASGDATALYRTAAEVIGLEYEAPDIQIYRLAASHFLLARHLGTTTAELPSKDRVLVRLGLPPAVSARTDPLNATVISAASGAR